MAKSEHPRLHDLKILIVEDDETSAEFLKEVLEEYHVELVCANNAEDAISICRNDEDLDLVLMDIRLPRKNGYEAIREIKKIKKDLPVIAQTAYAFERDKHKAFDSGCNGYIAKPIKAQQLLEVIEKILE